jgi:hypothetical protein
MISIAIRLAGFVLRRYHAPGPSIHRENGRSLTLACRHIQRLVLYLVMSTLAEIESAVRRLPLAEQEQLLRHLGKQVRRHRTPTSSVGRAQWMSRLDQLRASIGSGAQTLSSEQILSESREERL